MNPVAFRALLALLGLALTLPLWVQSDSSEAQVTGPRLQTAIFAGGCFWCMEPPFDRLPGVVETISGYSGGAVKNPSYEQVSAGNTGHLEVLRVTYDSAQISYHQLLQVFWRNIDPYDAGGQFCDRGVHYRSAIFYASSEQKMAAEQSLAELSRLGLADGAVATKLLPAQDFYPAEEYHQDYYLKNPRRYKYYRWSCGRDKRLEELWGSSSS